ncbi:MAG: cupin domain-containing protein [Firmicutes bacterium HGW-Firmicutes-11]|jgi:quercetin dioxygenase-like cupin family protein|nr:MAG: cupin domain-containing protein [Firmicutes bacterium HGW-Firmicutes-11]
MEQKVMKNIDVSTPLIMKDLVQYQTGQIVSKTIAQNKSVSLTLFAFDKGEEISSHESDGDAIVMALDGTGEVTIGDEKFIVNAGDTIVMPNKTPHAVYATEQFKMFLIVVFPA